MVSRPPFGIPLAASLLAAALFLPAASGASAQGLLDFLFGGFRHYRSAPPVPPRGGYGYAPFGMPFFQQQWPRRGGLAETAHCVRLCDGSHFPLQARAAPERLCNALCPASRTEITPVPFRNDLRCMNRLLEPRSDESVRQRTPADFH